MKRKTIRTTRTGLDGTEWHQDEEIISASSYELSSSEEIQARYAKRHWHRIAQLRRFRRDVLIPVPGAAKAPRSQQPFSLFVEELEPSEDGLTSLDQARALLNL